MYSRSKIGNPVRGMRRRSYATASRSENVARRLGELNRMIAARSVQRAFRSNYGYMPVDAPERLRYPSGREMIAATIVTGKQIGRASCRERVCLYV